jgi:chromosome segregation ATPase
VEDDEQPSRSGTPRPKEKPNTVESATGNDDGKEHSEKTADADEKASTTPEISPEVQTRLRKLEKLEPKYTGERAHPTQVVCLTCVAELLRSYRIAHARISLIEAFESSLREHTPLTSISEPPAFVEYLGQLNVKSDMLMEELKRVSKERDELNKKLEDSEKRAKDVAEVLEKLQTQGTADDMSKDDATQTESVAPSSASKMSKETDDTEDTEEFFSYDSELPRLQSQLKESEGKVERLEGDNKTLKNELSVAQESAESFMKNLEVATNSLHTLKDQNERARKEAVEREKKLDATVEELKAKLLEAEKDLVKHTHDRGEHENVIAQLQEKLNTTVKELEELHTTRGEELVENHDQETLRNQVEKLETDLSQLRETQGKAEKKNETLDGLVNNLRNQLRDAESKRDKTLTDLEQAKTDLRILIETKSTEAQRSAPVPPSTPITESASSKKKNRKKKKATKAGDTTPAEATPSEAGESNGLLSPRDAEFSPSQSDDAQKTISQLKSDLEAKVAAIQSLESEVAHKAASIDTLRGKLKDEEAMQEEIETLRQDLLDFGVEHTEAKDKVKELRAEKSALQERLSALEKEMEELRTGKSAHESSELEKKALTTEVDELKAKAVSLQTDLSVAEQLAATRFKDLTDMREILQKAQPELTSLRNEVTELRTTKEELLTKSMEVQRLESREKDLKSEIASYRSQLTEKDGDIKTLNDKIKQETIQRLALEETNRKIQKDLQQSESDRNDANDSRDRLTKDLAKVQNDLKTSRDAIRNLEHEVAKLKREADGLKDEIQLKSAQYTSAQDLMNSMQDQSQELGTQMKEVRARSDSLEEELADAHRLLSERSREAETMRRLLADAQGRADARVREMQERLDVAIEERERAEEQVNTFSRRRARDLEELKQKARDAERALTRAQEDKDDLASSEKELRRQKEDLERRAAQASEEATEVRAAMGQLRDALDDSEKQVRDLEKEKTDLRRAFDETQSRLEKLQKSSKMMSEEIRTMKTRAADLTEQSSRSSIESSRSRLTSPTPKSRTSTAQPGEAAVDYVYLKNVLLQFLEQKDKKYQQQLIPVLGMLLHFDKYVYHHLYCFVANDM